jgi:hypothetical protein
MTELCLRRVVIAAVLLAGVASARAELPAHAARIVQPTAPAATLGGGTQGGFGNQIAISGYAWPSPDDDRFDSPLGLGVDYDVLLEDTVGLRFSAGYESWETASDADIGGNVDVVPIGVSVLLGPSDQTIPLRLELGLRYLIVDSDASVVDLDNALAALLGLDWQVLRAGGTGVKITLAYQFDIEEAGSNVADIQDVSFEGLRIGVGLTGGL